VSSPCRASPVSDGSSTSYIAGSSDKFRDIEVNDKKALVRFGRNGTSGQSSTKSFADEAVAKQHAEKLIEEKTGKGYVETK
jgi:predicted DNA-binding WGR domain protein